MCSNKSPISLLQEILMQQSKQLPIYQDSRSDLSQFPFKCSVKVGGMTANGYAFTKKEAKQKCAQEALLKLGIGLSTAYKTNSKPSGITVNADKNYIGMLHEHASAHQLPNPMYCDKLPVNGLFQVECHFLGAKTEGTGITKKSAKQDSSKKMLENPEIQNFKDLVQENAIDSTENSKLNQIILEKYKELSIMDAKPETPSTDFELPKFEVPQQMDMKELIIKIEATGRTCSLIVFQKNPYIMALKLDNNQIVMGCGDTQQGATDHLLETCLFIFHGMI